MGIFPFINQETTEDTELEVFKEYAFDFVKNEFKTINDSTYLVEKNEALEIWIYKTLHTERFMYLAYSSVYGNEVYTLIGKVNTQVLNTEMQRFIVEALMVNPYIKELSEFKFAGDGSEMEVEFLVTTIYGDMLFSTEYKGV